MSWTSASLLVSMQLAASSPSLAARDAAPGAAPPPPQVAPSKGPVLHLEDAIQLALKNQPTLKQARAQTEAADARVDGARASALPQVTAIASYQRVRSAAIGGRGAATTTGAGGTAGTAGAGTAGTPSAFVATGSSGVDIFTFGGSATQVIWDFGQTYNRTRAAKRLAAASEATEAVSAKNVVVDVRRSYFAARAQRSLVDVARASIENLQRHLDQIQGFVQVGTRPEIDLAQARTDVANGQLSLINAQNAYATAKAQLGRSIGMLDLTGFEVGDDDLAPVDGEELPVARLTAIAIEKRPETLAAERQVDSYEMSARAYRGSYAPTLSASAGASETGTSLGSLGPAWNVGAALTWPIFQGGQTKALVREAEANADAARAQLETTKLQIRLDIQQAQIGIQSAKAARVAADEVVTNARVRLRLAEGRYAQGVGSVIELGDAQLVLTNALAQVVQAQYQLASARADLLAALGRQP